MTTKFEIELTLQWLRNIADRIECGELLLVESTLAAGPSWANLVVTETRKR